MAAPLPPAGGDVNLGPTIMATCLSTLVVGIVCVVLRSYVRVRITNNFWWDDGLIVAAMFLSIAGAVFVVLDCVNGTGRHLYYLPDPANQIPAVIKWIYWYEIDNIVSVNVIKVSMLLFILRLQNTKEMRYTAWTIIVVMTMVNIVTACVVAAQCIPIAKQWNPDLPGWCLAPQELGKFSLAQSVFSVISDIFCTVSPVIILWKIRISRNLKIGICSLMSIGIVATAANIVRSIYLDQLSYPDTEVSQDLPYSASPVLIAAFLENNLGLIAACIPTLQPLFRKSMTRSQQTSKGSSTERSYFKPPRYKSLQDGTTNTSKNDTLVNTASHADTTDAMIPLHELDSPAGIYIERGFEVTGEAV